MWALHFACFFFYTYVNSRPPQRNPSEMNLNKWNDTAQCLALIIIHWSLPSHFHFGSNWSFLPYLPHLPLMNLLLMPNSNYSSSVARAVCLPMPASLTHSSFFWKALVISVPSHTSLSPPIEFLLIFKGSDQTPLLFVAFSDHSNQKCSFSESVLFNNYFPHVVLAMFCLMLSLYILIISFLDFKLIVERDCNLLALDINIICSMVPERLHGIAKRTQILEAGLSGFEFWVSHFLTSCWP